MPADVEAEPLIHLGSGDAAHVVRIRFPDIHCDACLAQDVGGGEAGRPCADDADFRWGHINNAGIFLPLRRRIVWGVSLWICLDRGAVTAKAVSRCVCCSRAADRSQGSPL